MRIGRIGYINCAPVYGAIDRGVVALPPGGELVTGTPAELNDLLVAGALDVSVISAIEYARHAKDLMLLPELAISCDGPVRSVALFSRWTRQPFVFAAWSAQRSAAACASIHLAHTALLASRAWGLAHLDDLAVEASRKTGVPVAACREYLGGLDYAFSDQHRTALTDFLRRVGSLQFVQVA